MSPSRQVAFFDCADLHDKRPFLYFTNSTSHKNEADLIVVAYLACATGWRPRGLIGAVVCLLAAPRVQLSVIGGQRMET